MIRLGIGETVEHRACWKLMKVSHVAIDGASDARDNTFDRKFEENLI